MDIKLVKQLREKTGASVLECQKALEEVGGNLVKAEEVLRKKGQKIIEKRAGRETKAGIIGVYLHNNERMAAMVELTCETDFVARNEEFKALAHDLAMQVVATNPLFLSPEEVPAEIIEKEKEIYRAELSTKDKSISGEKKEKRLAEITEKIIDGKLAKYFETNCLLKQKFIKDDKLTIEELIKNKIAKIGENIQIKKFVKLEI